MNYLLKDGSQPLVTVIIPAYNHEHYIADAMDSVFQQTYQPIEVIVIDDESKDGTRAEIVKLKKKYQFRYIENKKNLGLTKSLNKALGFSNGKYISILAGDDIWMSEKTALQVEFMENNADVAACSGNVSKIDKDGNPYRPYTDRKVSEIEYRTFDECMQLKARFPAIVALVRKKALDDVGGYDERFVMEDMPLWLKLTDAGWKLSVLTFMLGAYRVHGEGLHNNRKVMFDSYVRLMSQYSSRPVFKQAMKSIYIRQIKFGPYQGIGFMLECIVKGRSFTWLYIKNVAIGLYKALKLLKS